MRLRRTERHGSEEQTAERPTLESVLVLAQARIAEVEAATRKSREDLDRLAGEMGVSELRSSPPGGRDRLAAELVDSVTARIASLDREAAALVALLERSTALLSPQGAESVAQREPDLEAPAASVGRRPTPISEGVRLLATQMAVAGSSRSEIEDRLRRELDVSDPEALVDELLGSARA